MCEQYNLLIGDKKRMIADELDRTPAEIQKKAEDLRIRAVQMYSNSLLIDEH